uniref:Thioredoxin domain-containing protein n=1 Tax=Araucaria cunninghamii TaxID=56994 RepID=A0A0D6R883_ARACU
MGSRVLRRTSQLCYTFLHSRSRFFSSGSSPFLEFREHGGLLIPGIQGLIGSKGAIPRISLPGHTKFVYSISWRNMSTDATKVEKIPNKQAPDGSAKAGDKDGSDRTTSKGRPVREGPVTWMSLVLLVITGAGLIIYFDREKKRRIEEIKNSPAQVKEGPSVGKAAIGGPFNLVNHDGKPVTEHDFKGKWTLIYFGFTHCPDICPDELQKMVTAIDKIKQKSGLEVVPVFISVDPDRDTVEQVREYVKEFHPNLIGLTGSQSDIGQVAREFRVYYMKTEEEEADYLVDHSIIMYLMDPDMEFVKFFGKNYEVEALTEGVIKEIKGYKK